MKNRIPLVHIARLAIVLLILIVGAVVAATQTRSVTASSEIPAGTFYDYQQQINDRGQAIWNRRDTKNYLHAIFMFDGLEEVQLTDYATGIENPQINNNGWAVWNAWNQSSMSEVLLFNGSETTQLTDNSYHDSAPQINDLGWVAWNSDVGVHLYNGQETKQIHELSGGNTATSVGINNKGWVVWTAWDGHDSEIFVYDGIKTIQITDNSGLDNMPRMNDRGWITWSGSGSAIPPEGMDEPLSTIWLFDGAETTQLPEIAGGQNPQINSNGWVTWMRVGSIFLYNGTETTELYERRGSLPQINDKGWVVWSGHDGHDREIFLFDGTQTVQLTDNDHHDRNPQINNLGWDPLLYLSDAAMLSRNASIKSLPQSETTEKMDDTKPRAFVSVPFVSTKISKTTTFKVEWGATDPSAMAWATRFRAGGKNPVVFAGDSGINSYTVRYRPSTSRKWRTWKKGTKATHDDFTGKAGVTYYFRVRAEDNAGNYGWSKVRKTIIPFNEGMSLIRRIGFNGYFKNSKSPFFLSSVRYSYTRGNTLVYKLYNNNGIGLVATKGPNRGRAKIYVDGKYVKTIDANKPSLRPRQLVFYRGFRKKGTHWLKIINLGTPGRARFDVDGIVVAR